MLVSAKLDNLEDLFEANRGRRAAAAVRSVEVDDALIDTWTTGLYVPRQLIAALGLVPIQTQVSRNLADSVPLNVYRGVRLTVQGRDCISDVIEVSDDCPVIVGQAPLHMMDWTVVPGQQRLVDSLEMIDA